MSDDEGPPPAAADVPSLLRPRVQFTLPEAQDADADELLHYGDDELASGIVAPGAGAGVGSSTDPADVDDVDDDDDDVAYLDRIDPAMLALDAQDDAVSAGDDDDDVVVVENARKPRLPVARVRRLVAEGSVAPTVSADAAKRAALSTEDFIADLVVEASRLATRRHGGPGGTVTYAHLAEVAQTVERFAFLADVLLPEKKTLPKGQRTLAAAFGGQS
jgi:hypothetical protein